MNKKFDKKYWQAVAVMIGYIVGVGMFGLPFVTAKSGILVFLVYLFVLGFIQYFVHLIYANMIVVTESYHRLPGYVGKYLGLKGKTLVAIAKLLGNYGALLAYIIISGSFLFELLNPYFGGSEFLYGSIIFIFEAIVVFFGIGMIARFELVMTILLALVVFLLFSKGATIVSVENYKAFDTAFLFLPFGAMLMALDGNGSLPIVAKLLKKDHFKIKKVIRTSMLVSALITLVFVLTIVGISGSLTTQNALSGVKLILNDGVIVLALIFGVITMMTSVFGVAESIKETLWWDYKVNKTLSWALAVSVPYLLYVSGVTSLIGVIGFAGAIAGGFSAIMMILTFMKMKQKGKKLIMFDFFPGNYLLYIIILLLFMGGVYEIWSFLS
jgi:amino acid permease